MKTTFISTTTLWSSPRVNLDRLQSDLAKANKELVSSRQADVGLHLGYRTGETITLRQERAQIDAFVDSNGAVKIKLDAASRSLQGVRETADTFLNALIATPASERSFGVIKAEAEKNLGGMIGSLNIETSGQYLFAGINTQVKPMASYSGTPASPAREAINTAFVDFFGFAQTDARVADITAAEITAFLEGPYQEQFRGSNWKDNWSNASDRNIASLISPSEMVETSVNTNAASFQDIAMAYTMIFDTGMEGMNASAREVVISKAIFSLSSGVSGARDLEAGLGLAKAQIVKSDERMEYQKVFMETALGDMEGVDPVEAKIRIDNLTTQINASYALTAQLRGLSLLNFL